MPRPPLRRLRVALSALVLLLLTAACSASASSGTTAASTATPAGSTTTPTGPTGESAPAADQLVVYSGRSKSLVDPLLQEFEKTTDTKVFVRYADSPSLAAQLGEEGERTQADVFFSQDAGALGALTQTGRLEAIPAPLLERVPARYRAADGTWVGTSGRVRVLAYNPGQVPARDLPASVFDLTDPRWKGRVAYAPTNASFQAFVTGMRLLRGDEATRRWLDGMQANGIKAYDNNVRVLDAVDRGEASIGLLNHYYWYERVAEVGAEKVTARLHYLGGGDPGGLVNVAGAGVLAGTDKRDAAVRLVDFLLSPRAQQYFADETKEYPLAAGVRPARDLPPLDKLGGPQLDLSRLEDLQATQTMLEQVGLI